MGERARAEAGRGKAVRIVRDGKGKDERAGKEDQKSKNRAVESKESLITIRYPSSLIDTLAVVPHPYSSSLSVIPLP